MVTSDINYKGSFDSIEAVWAAYPYGGIEGDYLLVNNVKYRWNKYVGKWENAEVVTETPARDMVDFDADVNMQNNLTVAGVLRAKKFVVDDLPTGIEEVEYTESAVSGGTNVLTITYTNGDTETYNIKNGEVGKTMGSFGYASSTSSQASWNTAKNYLVPTENEGEFSVYTYEGDEWSMVDTFEVSIAGTAEDVEYDDTTTQLDADNVQEVIEKVAEGINILKVEIPTTGYQTLPCAISSSTGNWTAASSTSTNRHILIPIEEGETYLLKKNADMTYYQYAWLTDDTISAGNAAPLVTGTSVGDTGNNNKIKKITAPVGAKYIFIRTGYGETTARYPAYFGKLSNITKVINDNYVAKEIDTSIYPSLPYAIAPATGKWTSAASSNVNRHIIIPVKEGSTYQVTRNDNLGATYAWLTSTAASAEASAPLVTNTVAVNTGSTSILISAPTGAKYMYLRVASGTTEMYYPKKVVEYVPQDEMLQKLQKDADNIVEEDIQLNSNVGAWANGATWTIVTSTTGGMIIKLPDNAQYRIDAQQNIAAFYVIFNAYHEPVNNGVIIGYYDNGRKSVTADQSTGWLNMPSGYNYLYIGMYNASGNSYAPKKLAIRHDYKDEMPTFTPQSTYIGNPLGLGEFDLKKTFTCEAYPTARIGYWDNTTNYAQQSLAIYNGLIFLFYHAGYCKVLDAETFEVLYSFQMNEEISHSNNHCGNSCFSEVFFSASDEFPLLYMSNHLESKCYVLRIVRDVNGGFSESSISVVQYIANATGTEHSVYHFYPHGKTLICHYDVGTNQCYVVFNLPTVNTSSVETVLLDYADKIDEFSFPRENHTAAGQVARNGRIFALMYGASNTSPRYDLLVIYNFEKRVMDAKIYLTGRLARTEFEGIDVYDGKIYIGYNVTDQIGIIKTDLSFGASSRSSHTVIQSSEASNTYTSLIANNLTRLKNSTLNVIGDSVSNPSRTGYSLSTVWWGVMSTALNMTVGTYSCISGTGVAGSASDSFHNRISGLTLNGGVTIVAGGMNDLGANNIPLGTFDYSSSLTSQISDDATLTNNFIPAYRKVIEYILSHNKNTRLYLCTITPRAIKKTNMSDDDLFFPWTNLTTQNNWVEFNDAIRKLAHDYGIGLIDFANIGMYQQNGFADESNVDPADNIWTSDGVHPNVTYQKKMGELATRVLAETMF